MNIPLQLELPVLNLLRFTSRTLTRISVKDDPYSNFALKKKAETIHSILGIACCLCQVHPSINFTSNFVTFTGLKLPKAKQLLKKERALVQKPLAHYTKILEILEPFTPVFAQSKESTSLLLSSPPIIQAILPSFRNVVPQKHQQKS